MKSVSTVTHPQTRQVMRNEKAGATVLAVEKHETVEVPAGKFETIVLRFEGETPSPSPAVTRTEKRAQSR